VFAINDRGVSERGLFEHEKSHGLAGLVARRSFVEIAAQFGGGDDALGFFVEDDFDHDPLAAPDLAALLAEGKKEIFGKAPIEAGPHPRMHLQDGESGEVADLAVRYLAGGDDAIFRVARDENGDLVALLHLGGHLARRQQDLPERTTVEIKTVIRFTDDE